MDKAQAKKYIKGRQLEIMCTLEVDKRETWRKRLEEEFAFLKYVSNLIDFAEEFVSLSDECDDIPEDTIFEYKGYILKQSGYNNHYMIFKDGKMMMHCQCAEKLDQKKAEESIDFFIDLTYGRLADETERIKGEIDNGRI